MKNDFDSSKKDPVSFLTFAYVLALSVIAFLTIGSHTIITRVIESQRESAEIVYTAGRQRVLAQQIVFYATMYARQDFEKDRLALENSIFNFELGHQFLTQVEGENGTQGPRPMSAGMTAIYYEPPYKLDKQVKDYVEIAKSFLTYRKGESEENRNTSLEAISQMATGPLIMALDKAAQTYQEETLEEIGRLEFIQLVVMVSVLVILLLEALFIFQPLTSRVKGYSRQLLHIAMKDALTGLDNRRSFMDRIQAELSRSDRHSYPLCIVLTDIDKFKSVNDTYGHDVGDKVIRHFADVMKRTLRTEDVIGRIGGEEFALVLPQTSGEKGFFTIDRLRQRVENTRCHYGKSREDGKDLNYTASFGIVEVTRKGNTVEELLKMADEALYEAKRTGRNKVVMKGQDSVQASV
ncbi:MAG: diguanylate cyclase [Alphaproteobacteria bacterium]|nr:diguanylate cyclase [Alphaproteobacteria bacterium]